MEKKTLTFGSPVTIGEFTLLPLVKSSLSYWHGKKWLSLLKIEEPANLLVISPLMCKAYNMTGKEVPLDELERELPNLKSEIRRYTPKEEK